MKEVLASFPWRGDVSNSQQYVRVTSCKYSVIVSTSVMIPNWWRVWTSNKLSWKVAPSSNLEEPHIKLKSVTATALDTKWVTAKGSSSSNNNRNNLHHRKTASRPWEGYFGERKSCGLWNRASFIDTTTLMHQTNVFTPLKEEHPGEPSKTSLLFRTLCILGKSSHPRNPFRKGPRTIHLLLFSSHSGSEFCERIAFYSIVANLVLFFTEKLGFEKVILHLLLLTSSLGHCKYIDTGMDGYLLCNSFAWWMGSWCSLG